MNAVELLTRDHRAVEELLEVFETAEPDERREPLAEIIRELSIHAAIEEAHLYPLIATAVDGGPALVEEANKEHQRVKEILARLDGKLDKAHTKEVDEIVGRLKRDLEHHVNEEETEVFPKLEEAVTQTRLDEVGRELRAARASAPSRPHPNQPPATPMTAWANSLVDKARDQISGRA